jgi:hypothetical protein
MSYGQNRPPNHPGASPPQMQPQPRPGQAGHSGGAAGPGPTNLPVSASGMGVLPPHLQSQPNAEGLDPRAIAADPSGYAAYQREMELYRQQQALGGQAGALGQQQMQPAGGLLGAYEPPPTAPSPSLGVLQPWESVPEGVPPVLTVPRGVGDVPAAPGAVRPQPYAVRGR